MEEYIKVVRGAEKYKVSEHYVRVAKVKSKGNFSNEKTI